MKVSRERFGDLVDFSRTPIEIDPMDEYARIGIYSWGKGMMHRDPDLGTEMGKMRYFAYPIPSLIFSNIQAWEGAVALAGDADTGFICSSRFFPYVPKDETHVSLRYLYEFFRSAPGLAIMRTASPGTQVRNKVLSRASLEDAVIPLPSRQDQDRIAAHLDSLARRSFYESGYYSAIEQKLVLETAADAPTEAIGELLSRDREWIEVDDETTYLPVGVSSFGKGMIRYGPCGRNGLSKMRYYYLRPGNLLLSNVMAWQGAVAVVEPTDSERVANNRFLHYRPRTMRITSDWLSSYFSTSEGTSLLSSASHMHSPTNHTLSLDAFESVEVPVPPIASQEHVSRVASQVKAISLTTARRDKLQAAIVPAARNEIFNSLVDCSTSTRRIS